VQRDGDDAPAGPDRGDGDLPIPPDRDARPVERLADYESRVRERLPVRETGRFSLTLTDEVTGQAVKVNVAPLTVDMILRSNQRDTRMLVGYLLESLVIAARELWPDFAPLPARKPLIDHEIEFEEPPPENTGPWKARWRRIQGGR
jgi:hypothetical protein